MFRRRAGRNPDRRTGRLSVREFRDRRRRAESLYPAGATGRLQGAGRWSAGALRRRRTLYLHRDAELERLVGEQFSGRRCRRAPAHPRAVPRGGSRRRNRGDRDAQDVVRHGPPRYDVADVACGARPRGRGPHGARHGQRHGRAGDRRREVRRRACRCRGHRRLGR